MTGNSDRWRPLLWLGGAIALVGLGAAGTYLLFVNPGDRQPAVSPAPAGPGPAAVVPAQQAPGGSAIAVTLTPDVLSRAGLEFALVRRSATAGGLNVPAVVAPDAYQQVMVTAASSGRVLAVLVEAGQVVRRGDVLVRLHSPEVADTERAFRAAQADLLVWERQVARLDRLVSIGAASQQELEAARAERLRLAAEVESLRSKLVQLGRAPATVAAAASDKPPDAEVTIVAPATGTIIQRLVNPGENVAESSELLAIADLSTVWVIGDVYERDLASVRVGSTATVTSGALPGEVIRGRVSYTDPAVAADTRTSRVRVEIPNPGARLRLGMFVQLAIDGAAGTALLVPRPAVQTIDRASVVYVADPLQPGRFIERSIRLGAASGEDVIVTAGLSEGDRVVTRGSFLVRSERGRQFPDSPAAAPAADAGAAPVTSSSRRPVPSAEPPFIVNITVTTTSFTPEQVDVPAGRPVRLVFTRVDEATCATEVLIPALQIKKALPLKTPVTIDLPAQLAGTLTFQCGMDMLRGRLVVK